METLNISKSGIFMIARLRKVPSEPQMQTRVELLTRDRDIELSGRVIRVAEAENDYLSAFAILLDTAANDTRLAFEALVEAELAQAG
jgi:hypothetical protein